MAEKKGHDTSFYQFLLFSQTLPGKIDRLVWQITLPCVAKNHTTQQNRTYQPTYPPTICTRFIIFPLGPWLRRRKCWTKRHSNSMVVSFFEDLGSFFAEKSRVEQGIFAWKMKVKNIPYNLILINLLHLLRISDHLFQTINVWKVHWWFFHRMSCHHPVNSIPIPGETLVRRLEKIEKGWRKMRPRRAYHIKNLTNKNVFQHFFTNNLGMAPSQ